MVEKCTDKRDGSRGNPNAFSDATTRTDRTVHARWPKLSSEHLYMNTVVIGTIVFRPVRIRKVAGAHILIRRGGCSFLAKAITVSDAGGRSLVIDEGAGRLRMDVEEGHDVALPVVVVSKRDGENDESAVK